MLKVSCYQTTEVNLAKALCSLAEKCYYNQLPTVIITPNSDITAKIDTALWTYSKKHFIPHATNLDQHPNLQPIYIATNIENPNQAVTLIFINASHGTILLALGNKQFFPGKFKRILFLYDELAECQSAQIKEILMKAATPEYDLAIESFIQNNKGHWQPLAT
jgi:DNA polymerase-3 subunit chi